MGSRHFFIFIIPATLIHITLVFYYFYNTHNTDGSIAQGKEGLIVGIGIAGSYTDTMKEVETELEITRKGVLEEDTKSELELNSDTKSKSNAKSKSKLEVKSEPEPKLKPEAKLKSEQKSKSEESSKTESNPKTKSGTTPLSTKLQVAQRATGTGKQKHSGGDVGAKQGYLSIVKRKISRAKKYPRSARQEGITGIVVVRFLIKLNGKVKKIELVKSSGDERLDVEAIKMLKRASPFPAIPLDVSEEALDLTLPIEFTLKTIKNKFY